MATLAAFWLFVHLGPLQEDQLATTVFDLLGQNDGDVRRRYADGARDVRLVVLDSRARVDHRELRLPRIGGAHLGGKFLGRDVREGYLVRAGVS